MAGTIGSHILNNGSMNHVSMESGLDGRNNFGNHVMSIHDRIMSQWSPA